MLHYKTYKTYKAYIEDQVTKPRLREANIRRKTGRKYRNFLKHFKLLEGFIDKGDRILCLGARFGEEVRAFRDMGYNAIGIDIFGEEKDLVIKGDWNDLPFSDGVFNCVYTNSIDHCNDLDKEIGEIDRVLWKTGHVVIDLNIQHCCAAPDKVIYEKFSNPERYEAMLWNSDEDVIDPFLEIGFVPKMVWYDSVWHTYLLERTNGKNV